ncbi:MAG: family transporter [Solirubrobacterales bacterium]|nr:family transporter [Solirubrobacterales bacterium]
MPQDGPSPRAIVRIVLTISATVALLYLLWLVRSTLLLVFIAVFLAVALGPAVAFFRRRGVPQGLSILLVYLLMAGSVVGVGLLIVPPIVNQVSQLSEKLPSYIDDLKKNDQYRKYDAKYHISKQLTEQANKLPSHLGDAAGALQSITVGAFGAIVQLVTVLTMTFFLLLDGGRIADFLLRIRGPDREERFRRIAGDIYRSVSGYVAGNLLISLAAGLSTYLVLTSLGVPFAVPLAVLMAFLDLIPLVGATLGGVTIAIVTLFNNFPTSTIAWVVFFIIYQQVENNVLQPVVYRRTVNVAPLAVIVAILIGGSLLGILGALVAIPVAATVQIIVRELWTTRNRAPSVAIVEMPGGSP